MIIPRPKELERINSINKWILIYGRRKTGKTYLVKNFVKYDEYFFIKTNKSILTKDNEPISYETFIELLKRGIEEKRTIVIDEFHRLEQGFFDILHNSKKQGKIILISSTLFLSKKLITDKSPLLGLFAEISMPLISLEESLNSLKKLSLSKKERMELAVILREPISIDYFNERLDAKKIMFNILSSTLKTIPALTGEIFSEEQREISSIYEGILRAIASGKIGTGEISSYLFSKKSLKKDDPSIIQQYLNNLISFGLIKKLPILNKNKFAYKIVSPLSRIFYYADEKYNISERNFSEEELNRIIEELMPRIIEDNIREFFSERLGLLDNIFENKDFDVDGYLTKFKKPEVIIETKWGNINNIDIKAIEAKMEKLDAKRKILFVQDKANLKSNLEIFDVDNLSNLKN